MTEEKAFKWGDSWIGATGAGILTLAFFLLSSDRIPLLVFGLILALLVAGLAWWAVRKGRRDMAIGLAVGYALLTLMSGGQCTLLVESGGFEGALAGFFIYPLVLLAWLLIGGIASVVRRRRRSGRDGEQ